jgi:hypothetical protein
LAPPDVASEPELPPRPLAAGESEIPIGDVKFRKDLYPRSIAEHEIKPALGRADHDGAGLLIGGIAHHAARDRGTE